MQPNKKVADLLLYHLTTKSFALDYLLQGIQEPGMAILQTTLLPIVQSGAFELDTLFETNISNSQRLCRYGSLDGSCSNERFTVLLR
jgi:hypothetical protein